MIPTAISLDYGSDLWSPSIRATDYLKLSDLLHIFLNMQFHNLIPLVTEFPDLCITIVFGMWDEVGECDNGREKMPFELEQERLDAYRRKVDQVSHCQAQLRQAVAKSLAEVVDIYVSLVEKMLFAVCAEFWKLERKALGYALTERDEKQKNERKSQILEVLKEINSISKELADPLKRTFMFVDEIDMSLRRLKELKIQLLLLRKSILYFPTNMYSGR